jgi:hypothetical protein
MLERRLKTVRKKYSLQIRLHYFFGFISSCYRRNVPLKGQYHMPAIHVVPFLHFSTAALFHRLALGIIIYYYLLTYRQLIATKGVLPGTILVLTWINTVYLSKYVYHRDGSSFLSMISLHHRYSISWADYPYTSSTCDVMYCRQRRHLYYDGENLKYYLIPSPPVLPS